MNNNEFEEYKEEMINELENIAGNLFEMRESITDLEQKLWKLREFIKR